MNHSKPGKDREMENSVDQVAGELFEELCNLYDGVKISVHAKKFVDGNAVSIAWINGPKRMDVKRFVDGFKDGYFKYIVVHRIVVK